MRTLLKILGSIVGLVVVVVAVTLIGARFADGPLEIIAGGPFTSGELITEEPDWSLIKEINTVEFQILEPATSRTTWIAEHNNRIYIPSGYMNTNYGKIWKQWPLQAEKDGRAILRVNGKLYERQLVRIKQHPDMDIILSELSRKYLGGQQIPLSEIESNNMWLFELTPRS